MKINLGIFISSINERNENNVGKLLMKTFESDIRPVKGDIIDDPGFHADYHNGYEVVKVTINYPDHFPQAHPKQIPALFPALCALCLPHGHDLPGYSHQHGHHSQRCCGADGGGDSGLPGQESADGFPGSFRSCDADGVGFGNFCLKLLNNYVVPRFCLTNRGTFVIILSEEGVVGVNFTGLDRHPGVTPVQTEMTRLLF